MDRNIAVVGCGYWGKNLVRNFAELGALHTICDSSPKVLGQFEALYPSVNRETSLDVVLANKEIEGLVISSPAALHYSMTKQALMAGKDVLVEKPLATTIQECQRMISAAASADVYLMVDWHNRWNPPCYRAWRAIRDGEPGDISYIY